MPWSAPTYTGGVVWQDLPSHLTPLNAADLNTEENAEASYAATVGQSVINYLAPLAATANSPLGDPIGRTKVLGTSTIAAPSLRQFVFADDAIGGQPGTVGDVKRITDGAMSSTVNPNQLSSLSYTFTGADVGKVVEVLGAVTTATAPNLYGYIGSVVGGVASIVSTHGGSTPVNASVTVSGATVTFGTDDSAALQTVANAVSTAGGGILGFSPFKAYWWSRHVPASNVTYDGHGATFYVMPLPADGANPSPAVWISPSLGQAAHTTTVSGAGQTISTTPSTLTVGSTAGFATSGTLYVAGVTGTVTYTGVSGGSFLNCTVSAGSFTATNAGRVANVGVANVTFRAMVWSGHGKEVHAQHPLYMVGGTNWRVYDCDFTLFAPDGVYLADVTGARVVDCTFDRVCAAFPPGTATTGNPTNFVPANFSDAYPLTDLHFSGNTVKGQLSAGVDITSASVSNPPQTVTFKAEITSNVIDSPACIFASIVIELGGGGGVPTYPAQDVVIANNTCTGGDIQAYFDIATGMADPTLLSRFVIAGNTVNATFAQTTLPGINFEGSYGLITGNLVRAFAGISIGSNQKTVALTGDFTNGSPTINNVAGGGAITNGTPLGTLTGIPAGTFLQSGAGTTTWTMSQAFNSTTATNQAFTATPQAQNVRVLDNQLRIVPGGTSTVYGILTTYSRNATIADNGIAFDPGVAVARGISLNHSGWMRVRDNDIDYATGDGIYAANCNDLRIKDNDIYNPSAGGAGSNGIRFNGVTGTHNLIKDNDIVDDRPAHLMANAVQTQGTATNLRVRDNFWTGFTGTPMDSLTGVVELRGNLPYNTSWPAGMSNPTPASGVDLATVPYRQEVYWYGGTVTSANKTPKGALRVQINNGSPGMAVLDPGDTIRWTYTAAPTIQVIPVV